MFRTKKVVPILVLVALLFTFACKGGLVAPVGGELTDKDLALDKYYQALKWYNNTLSNLMANITLLPQAEQQKWIQRADPIKESVDTALAGWKLAVESEDWATLNENRAEFKRLKNKLIDVVLELSQQIG